MRCWLFYTTRASVYGRARVRHGGHVDADRASPDSLAGVLGGVRGWLWVTHPHTPSLRDGRLGYF